MKSLTLLIILLFLCSCGATYTVDYEKGKDFTQFTNYQFWPDIDSGLSELDDKRIRRAIDSVLQTRNMTKTESNQFYVNFYARETLAESRNSLGIGIGSGGGNVGVGVSGGIPIGGPVIQQQLTIDIIEASANQDLVWQVVINGNMKEKSNPEQWESYYYKVIMNALKKFPPQ